MAIRLDITGFYYEEDVPFDAGLTTVLDVMVRAAENPSSLNGGRLSYGLDSKGFVSEIQVRYDAASTPRSRQDKSPNDSPFGLERPRGTYRYADDVLSPRNRVEVQGAVPGLLTWQYYVTDAQGRPKNNDREITPVVKPLPLALADGDRITWRLVAIFGLNQFIDAARQQVVMESKGQPLSLKAAGRLLRESGDIMSVAP